MLPVISFVDLVKQRYPYKTESKRGFEMNEAFSARLRELLLQDRDGVSIFDCIRMHSITGNAGVWSLKGICDFLSEGLSQVVLAGGVEQPSPPKSIASVSPPERVVVNPPSEAVEDVLPAEMPEVDRPRRRRIVRA